jgi:hypothetical protein
MNNFSLIHFKIILGSFDIDFIHRNGFISSLSRVRLLYISREPDETLHARWRTEDT